jgi:hypothetical protein
MRTKYASELWQTGSRSHAPPWRGGPPAVEVLPLSTSFPLLAVPP